VHAEDDADPEYWPTLQLAQTDALEAPAYCPAGQEMQFEAPADAENLPGEQLRHEDEAVAPLVARYRPAAQSEHADAPVAVEYCPAAHTEQADEPAAEYEPRAQLSHAALETTELYFPDAHEKHAEPDL